MGRLSLIVKFSITSLVLLAGISVLLGVGLTQQFEQQAVEQREIAVSSLVPPIIGPYLSGDLLEHGAQDDNYLVIDHALSYLGGLGLVRVKVWNRQGVIVYADDQSLVGKKMPLTPEIKDTLDGNTSGGLSNWSPPGTAEDRGYGELLRVNTPLQLAGSSEIGAAFEGYFDASDLRERINYINSFLWTGIGFGFSFLYTALFFIVYNASHKLTRQSEENAALYTEAQKRLVERQKAEEQTQRQVERLAALRAIDMAITSGSDLRVTLEVILDQVCAQLGVDAASILLLDWDSATMRFAWGRGFRTNAVAGTIIRPGEGHAGSAVLKRRMVGVVDLRDVRDLTRAALLKDEDFASYCVVPLIAKGEVKGVLEVFHRSPLHPDEEWTGFLEALAGQTAIAVDNATLFSDLQQSNMNLALAYDMTLEGWSRALDLRDKETEGHTERVTEVAVRLARFMGVSEEELVHVRRGALLHDIGKMGIPDSILLKPGPLTDEEWKVMRKHPVYAYQLLSPVPFLKPALDVPYCHHEKWDGTGYPRGLKGEQIPLAARIFAIVDVWDALSSDRPYRAALPEDEVYAHLARQSGKHFEPRVVEAFFAMQGRRLSPLQLVRGTGPLGGDVAAQAREMAGVLAGVATAQE